jgi:SAM-dependent methyltransferase
VKETDTQAAYYPGYNVDMLNRRHPRSAPPKPQGQITRGKTAQNRLRRVDLFFARYDPAVLRRTDGRFAHALFVDLGYGAEPFTTLETSRRLRYINPDLRVVGVEIDRARVAAAQPFADERTEFRLGGFNLPLGLSATGQPETVRAVRAFNVLRQYAEDEVAGAYAELARYVLPGGLFVEGTSDPYGRTWVANVMRRTSPPDPSGERATDCVAVPSTADWHAEALVFSTNFRLGFEPALFQPVLPKNYIHRMQPGEPIYSLMEAWKRAARRTQAERAWGLRRWFVAAAHALAGEGYAVQLHGRWPELGFLIVHLTTV